MYLPHPASTSKSAPKLKIDWCTHEAATFAVLNWHYSKAMPIGKLVKIGAWEDGSYVGCVIFARGNSNSLGAKYGLDQTEVCELVRVALRTHKSAVSRILAIALRFLKKQNPGLRLVVSFADPAQGHHGGIYQAGNWVYTGVSTPIFLWLHDGRWKHTREVSGGAFGGAKKIKDHRSLPKKLVPGKLRYLMPLDDPMRASVQRLAKPYPKKTSTLRVESKDSVAPEVPSGDGGANPTSTLQQPAV